MKKWRDIKDEMKKNYKENKKQTIISFVIILVLYTIIIGNMYENQPKPKVVTYNDFVEYLKEGKVDTVYYSRNNETMQFYLFDDVTKEMTIEERDAYNYDPKDMYVCKYPGYDDFRKDVLLAGANVKPLETVSILEMLYLIFQLAMPIAFIYLLFWLLKGQIRGLTPKDVIQTSDVEFSSIIGHEEILDDIKFITSLIKDPSKGEKVGIKPPKGLLFVGPPGTGKTLIAKAIAHEAGVPFLYQNASGFIEMYVGLGAKRVRDLFKIARNNAPCILFIDEIDAIGGKRGNNKGTSENEQTINAILQEMDGFDPRTGVFIIAATNRPDDLDDALVRSGRFDRQIVVNPPQNWRVRKELFKHYLSKFSVSDDVDIDNLSKQVSGFTGADVAMICNEAGIIAVMRDKDAIDTACIEEAIDKKVFKGNRSKSESHKKDKQIIAYHEAGHAVMSYILGEPIARASIQSTISGVGGVVFNQDPESLLRTDKDYENRILISYAGRASEEIKFKDVTTGASNDITQATQTMLSYIERLGFDNEFGLLDISVLNSGHLVDSKEITDRLSKMSKDMYKKCFDLLNENYDKVELLASKLLEQEAISGEDIELLFSSEKEEEK